ncbi:MAG: efflux RND transporter periplasmic adaptor subunit, partial [Fimbriimonadaceae bacterium]|nr:efflux RND transporter periplasmic adaptor subunit [Fimbriimonadaceae bacterium]
LFSQAEADLKAAQSRVEAAGVAARLEAENSQTRIRQAENSLALARVRLERAVADAQTQPDLSRAEIQRAEAEVTAQREALQRFLEVEKAQSTRQTAANLNRARIDLSTAQSEADRQQALLDKGYVSLAAVERSRQQLQAAQSAFEVAQTDASTLEADLRRQEASLRSRLSQAEAGLRTARANRVQVDQADRAVTEARRQLQQAELSLKEARDAALQAESRRIEVRTAQASATRSRVAAGNALENLRQTRVTAPRAGVVTTKYLEEGTIIPGAVSAFAEGTSIVQISDTTTMFVECVVDEADIATVKRDQETRIIVEAYPGATFTGRVERIFPAAESTNAVTGIKVRVLLAPESLTDPARPLRPGMNATVEFIQSRRTDVIVVPTAAIKNEGGETFVLVKTADPLKPERRIVKTGKEGNDGTEVTEGLKDGEEIVIAEINLAELRERQAAMQAAEGGGGGGLGASAPRGPSRSRASGGGGGSR